MGEPGGPDRIHFWHVKWRCLLGDAQLDTWRQGAEHVSQGRRVDLPTTLRLADTLQGWVWGGWGGPARGPAGAPL